MLLAILASTVITVAPPNKALSWAECHESAPVIMDHKGSYILPECREIIRKEYEAKTKAKNEEGVGYHPDSPRQR